MAIGATTGSRGGGSQQPGRYPAANPARPTHPAIGISGVGSQTPGGTAAYGGGRSRLAGSAAGLGGAGDHFGAPTHTGGLERPAGAPTDPGVRDDHRARGPWRQGEPGRRPVGSGHGGAPVRRFGGPDHHMGHPDHWPERARPGLAGRWRWFHPGQRWPWLYLGAWVEGGVPSRTVIWAQACLSRLLGIELPQNGLVGPDTQQAIVSFQAQQNLPSSGALDENTVSALQATCGAMEWLSEEEDESLRAGIAEPVGGLEYDTLPLTQPISDAIDHKDWPRVLELAMQVGWHDENRLTNLLFYNRHPELDRRPLKPQASKQDQGLAWEWNQILIKEVRPAIERAAEDRDLAVTGRFVAERDPQLSGEKGERFQEVVAWAAEEADLDPGFLAAVLLAEVGSAAPYLSPNEVSSFFIGTDDFYNERTQLQKFVPAFTKIHFGERLTNINEHGREVTSVLFTTGRDAALATAVYLKYGEIKLRGAMQKNGGDFNTLPTATRFALVRIAMAAGHGGLSPDGDLIRFKKTPAGWTTTRPGEAGGILLGVARSLDRVLKGEDILVRNWEPRKDPTNDSNITHRNATILASQAIHLGNWFFRAPILGVHHEAEYEESYDVDAPEWPQWPPSRTFNPPPAQIIPAGPYQTPILCQSILDDYSELSFAVEELKSWLGRRPLNRATAANRSDIVRNLSRNILDRLQKRTYLLGGCTRHDLDVFASSVDALRGGGADSANGSWPLAKTASEQESRRAARESLRHLLAWIHRAVRLYPGI
jgi:Putative peptidoglycan binding domain